MMRTICTVAILAGVCIGGCATKQPAAAQRKQTYAFWPAAPDQPHIQFVTAINSSKDIAESRKSGFDEMVYGADPEEVLAVQKPYGVRFWNGRIYVSETRVPAITVLDLAKQQTRLMGASGSGTVKHAVDIAISPDGTKYVVDQGDSSIKLFGPDERFIKAFGLPNTKLGGACVFGPYLYVTDQANSKVLILDRNYGKVLKTFGERGGLDGQFINPLAIAADSRGCVYISDPIRARVQKFGPDGTFLLGFGSSGNRPGNFIRPKHLGVGSDGHIHVVDAAFNNVQVFDPQGKFVGFYGAAGRHPGAMDLPAGLDIVEQNLELFGKFIHPAFQAERLIIVSNQDGGQKLTVYAMGGLKQGFTVADLTPQRAEVAAGTVAATQPALPVAAPSPTSRPAGEFATRP
jgi:DNA-binding beta-propeller fold protein YncE